MWDSEGQKTVRKQVATMAVGAADILLYDTTLHKDIKLMIPALLFSGLQLYRDYRW